MTCSYHTTDSIIGRHYIYIYFLTNCKAITRLTSDTSTNDIGLHAMPTKHTKLASVYVKLLSLC